MLTTLIAILSILAQPETCDPREHDEVFPSLPAPFPSADPACWDLYTDGRDTAQEARDTCIQSIPLNAPDRCARIAECDALYAAWMEGLEEGYVECTLKPWP